MRPRSSVAGDDSPVSTFGDRVQKARRKRGLSQADLAQALGVSPSAIRDWEARERSPRDWQVYRALAEELDVSADHLLDVRRKRRGKGATAAEAALQEADELAADPPPLPAREVRGG